MPIKDDDERRAYFREYMRRRRAERADVTLDDELEGDSDSQIAPPEVIEDNILYTIARTNEHARIFNKHLKLSAMDLEAIARINAAIERMMGKWRFNTVDPWKEGGSPPRHS
jgi:hypothetical protein